MWDKIFSPVFCCTAAHNIDRRFYFRMLVFFNTSFYRIGFQEKLLPHGLDVTSITWTMPFELQTSNTLGRGCDCPFKGLKSFDPIIIKLQLQLNRLN